MHGNTNVKSPPVTLPAVMGYVAILLELNYAKMISFRNLELLRRWGIGSSQDLPKKAKTAQ
jgi:hypothetical protein